MKFDMAGRINRVKNGNGLHRGTKPETHRKPETGPPTSAPPVQGFQTKTPLPGAASPSAVMAGAAPEVHVDIPVPTKDRSSYDGDTAIKLYLRENGQVKLLTPDEEIELAGRIKKGDKKARE